MTYLIHSDLKNIGAAKKMRRTCINLVKVYRAWLKGSSQVARIFCHALPGLILSKQPCL